MSDGRLVVAAVIMGEPHPAERPRVSRDGHMYVPSTTTRAVRAITEKLRVSCPSPETSFDVEVWLTFRRATRGRVDVDNLAKTVLDACKGVVWRDDSQVALLHVAKHIGVRAGASTTIEVRRILPAEIGWHCDCKPGGEHRDGCPLVNIIGGGARGEG